MCELEVISCSICKIIVELQDISTLNANIWSQKYIFFKSVFTRNMEEELGRFRVQGDFCNPFLPKSQSHPLTYNPQLIKYKGMHTGALLLTFFSWNIIYIRRSAEIDFLILFFSLCLLAAHRPPRCILPLLYRSVKIRKFNWVRKIIIIMTWTLDSKWFWGRSSHSLAQYKSILPSVKVH